MSEKPKIGNAETPKYSSRSRSALIVISVFQLFSLSAFAATPIKDAKLSGALDVSAVSNKSTVLSDLGAQPHSSALDAFVTAAGHIDWSVVDNKPATFAPSAHTHPESDVTNLVTDLAAKAPLASPSFSGVIGMEDNQGLLWNQPNTGLGQLGVSAGSGIVFNGDHDPALFLGYNHFFTGHLSTEPQLSWVVEGNYNDASGHNKMEAYLQYTTPDLSTNIRPIFFQFDKVTNTMVAAYYMGNPVQLQTTSGTSIARFTSSGSFLDPTSGSDNSISVLAPASKSASLTLGSNAQSNTFQITSPSSQTSATMSVNGGNVLRLLNSSSVVGLNVGAGSNDTSGIGVFVVNGNTTKKGIIARGMASQSGNLIEAQDSSSTPLFAVTKDGMITGGGIAYNADVAKSADYTVVTTDRGKLFEMTTGASDKTFTLPAAATAGNGFFIVLRKADGGAGKVLTSPSLTGLGIQGHTSLVWTDGTTYFKRDFYGSIATDGSLTISSSGSTTLSPAGSLILGSFTGLLKGTFGTVGTATAGADYQLPPQVQTQSSDADFTISSGKTALLLTATLTAPRTATLPAANSLVSGQILRFVDVSQSITSTNTIALARAGSDTINGGTSNFSISAAGAVRELVSDGTSKWTVISTTQQGNTFNGTSQLMQTDSSGKAPVIGGTLFVCKKTGVELGSGGTTTAISVSEVMPADCFFQGGDVVVTSVSGFSSATLPIIKIENAAGTQVSSNFTASATLNAVNVTQHIAVGTGVAGQLASGSSPKIHVSTLGSSTTQTATVYLYFTKAY